MKNKQNTPNCFIVGAAKAGTTSLFYYLGQHKDVFLPRIKEPNFFSSDIRYKEFRKEFKKDTLYNVLPDDGNYLHNAWIDDENIYKKLFMDSKEYKISIDASVSYLYSKEAAKNIYNHSPNSKILIILRNPIDRAYSHYLMNLQIGYTNKELMNELMDDYNKNTKGWGISNLYIEAGLYYEQLKRYLDLFPQEQVKIICFEEFKKNTKNIIDEITNFLNIEKLECLHQQQYNASKVPKNPALFRKLKKIAKLIPTRRLDKFKNRVKKRMFYTNYKPVLSNNDRKVLNKLFEKDIKKLSILVANDLKDWIL